MSAYESDDRVLPRDDGTWVVFDGPLVYSVAPYGDQWAAYDTDGFATTSPAGEFDDVVYTLIGDPA